MVPALRKGALTGSERWLVASMVPGAHPFAELEAALLRSTIDAPTASTSQLADPTLGLAAGSAAAAARTTPPGWCCVIDQFEELFTLVDDEAERRRFLDNLVAAVDDPQGRVLVVITLRPTVPPPARLRRVRRPPRARRGQRPATHDRRARGGRRRSPRPHRGVTFEPALLAELLTDVLGEPGALPVFQYALTELFERRTGNQLTLDAYRSLGGVRGCSVGGPMTCSTA